jgi:uncharacterized protein (TIGR03118 family)
MEREPKEILMAWIRTGIGRCTYVRLLAAVFVVLVASGWSATVHDGNVTKETVATPLVAHLPQPSSGIDFGPTGIVFNGTNDFVVFDGVLSAPARFILAGKSGAIAGWSSSVDPANAIVVYVEPRGASYTGLTLANNGTANFLYAADFANGRVDVFDKDYVKQAPSNFKFTDASLPAGYAPFGIQALPTGLGGAMEIYVAYAMKIGDDEEVGDGLGIVDVYDVNGALVRRLVDDGDYVGTIKDPDDPERAPPDLLIIDVENDYANAQRNTVY